VGPRAGRAVAVALSALVAILVALPSAIASKHRDAAVPPPTPVALPGGRTSPSPFPTALHTPPPSAATPQIAAGSAVLADLDTGQVLFASDADVERPIASLTKLMTAVLVLRRADPADVVTVSERASTAVGGIGISELGLRTGERIGVRQLLYALLLQSANDAAVALAEHVSGSVEAFVKAMNAQAGRLGMRHTRFYSPNGLDDRGYSTALDLARLTRAAYGEPLFQRIDTTKFHRIPAPEGPARRIQNRNVLLWLYRGAIGGKTGFTSAAGFCVVAAARREGIRLVAVVLGAPGEPFSDAAELLNYGFAAFDRKRLVEEGQAFDPVEIQGRGVPVAAPRPLDALVPADAGIRYDVVRRADVGYPPALGEPVATLRVRAGQETIRRMPLVVTEVPPPPPPSEPGPWWRRAAGATADALSSAMSALFG
jgi:serine-type D-Ala-D-Ala carboxypeptidase (penicillin-binding protein 5/6)